MKIHLITAILLIIILALCSGFLLYNSNEKISQLQNELENLNSLYSAKLAEDEVEEKTTENSEKIIPSIFTATEKNKTQGIKYSFEEYDINFSIDIRDGVPYIATRNTPNSSLDQFLSHFNIDKNQFKLKNSDYTEITGFSKKVINAHIGSIGQDDLATTFVFLMEDGTIEYSTLSNMLTNVSTQGTVNGLNNIVSIHDASADDTVNGGGHVTILVLDNDNYFYNIADFM